MRSTRPRPVTDEANGPDVACHREEAPEGIPLADIPFEKLPQTATLWLASFERWKQERPAKRKPRAVKPKRSNR